MEPRRRGVPSHFVPKEICKRAALQGYTECRVRLFHTRADGIGETGDVLCNSTYSVTQSGSLVSFVWEQCKIFIRASAMKYTAEILRRVLFCLAVCRRNCTLLVTCVELEGALVRDC